MPKYQFVAEGPNQESHKGVVEAETHAAARQKLEQHGFRVLTIVVEEPVEQTQNLMPPGRDPQPAASDLKLDPEPLPSPEPVRDLPVATPALPVGGPQPGFAQSQPSQPQPAGAVGASPAPLDEEGTRPLARAWDPWIFDFTFQRFVTPNAVTVIFTMSLIGAVLWLLFVTGTTGYGMYNLIRFGSRAPDAWTVLVGLGSLVVSWLVAFAGIVFWMFLVRIFCEAMLVAFRMAENLERIRKHVTT